MKKPTIYSRSTESRRTIVKMEEWMRNNPDLRPRGKGGALKLDKSYNFVEKNEIIYYMRDAIGEDGRSMRAIANRAGINHQTLKKWFTGKTQRPQLPTVLFVLRAMGKKLKVVDQ
jgi:DNA-binding phage protein